MSGRPPRACAASAPSPCGRPCSEGTGNRPAGSACVVFGRRVSARRRWWRRRASVRTRTGRTCRSTAYSTRAAAGTTGGGLGERGRGAFHRRGGRVGSSGGCRESSGRNGARRGPASGGRRATDAASIAIARAHLQDRAIEHHADGAEEPKLLRLLPHRRDREPNLPS
eukprot:2476085-Prymnesium_polylepis.2